MIERWIYVFALCCFVEAQLETVSLSGGNNSNQNVSRNETAENPTTYTLYDSSVANEGRGFPSGHFGEPFFRTPIRRYHPGPIKIGTGSKSNAKPTSNSYAKIPDTGYQPQSYENFPPYSPEEVTKPSPPDTMMNDDNSDKGQPSEDYNPYQWGYSHDTDNNDDDNPVFSKHPVYQSYSDYMPEKENDDSNKEEDTKSPPEYDDHPWNYHPKEQEEDDDMGNYPKRPIGGGKNKKPEYLDHPPWHSVTEEEDDNLDDRPKEEEENDDMGKHPKRPMNGGKNKKPEYLDHPPWHSITEEEDENLDDHPKEEEGQGDMGKHSKRPMNGGKNKKPEYLDHPPWHSTTDEDDKKPEDDSKKSKHKYPQYLDHDHPPPWKDTSVEKPMQPTYPPWYSVDVKAPEKGKPSYFIDEMKDQGKENHEGYWEFHGPEKQPEKHPEEHPMDEERNKRPYSYYYLGRKLWYIPLYFSAYFIIYVTALILRSIARHKIAYPLYHNVDWAKGRSGGNYITQLADTVSEAISNTAKKYI